MMAFKRVLENILRKTSDLVKSTKDAVDEYDTPENREKITDSVLAASEATVKKVKGLGDLVAEYAEAPDFFKSKKLTSEPNRYEHPAEACEDISDAAYKKNKGSNTEPGRRLLRIIEQNYLHWEDLKGAEIFCPGIGKGTIEDVMERSKYIPLITVALLPDSHRATVSSSRIQINSDTLKKDGVIITLGQTAKKTLNGSIAKRGEPKKDLDDQEKKKDYIKGATQIEQHCEQRGIEKLYHFTPLENVESILDSGICARAELENREDAPIFPDPQRLDGLPYWISASISFPNYKMFYSYRCRLKTKVASWAIICLDVSVLWKLKCRYYPSNAARNYDQDVLLDDLSSPEAFERLFLPHLSWSSNCTTDPQAEVMIHKHIPKTYFKNVIVENNKSKTIISSKSVPLPISVDPSLFKPREDYENWR